MSKKTKSLSLASRGLKYKLKISFYLMSILPLLVCMYLVVNYIFPKVGLKIDVVIATIVSAIIAVFGFFVLKEVFDRISSVSVEAKRIAAGDLNHTLEVKESDEVGDLGEVINQLTQRIRSNMDELKNYSEKTTEINIEIQRRVVALSSLLQISSLITQSARLEDILKLITEKSRLLANAEVAYLLFRTETEENFSMKSVDGVNSEYLLKINVDSRDAIFHKTIHANKPLILDKDNPSSRDLAAAFFEKFKLRNTLALPVYLRGKVYAILGIGNTSEYFVYKKEDIELLDIFAKQTGISIENDLLLRRIEKLEVKDALTGLYNMGFIHSRLQEEIGRAIRYQRPCAFIIFDIDHCKKFNENFGLLPTEAALKKIGLIIRDSVSVIDRVGRIADDEFAVILPEKNKRQAQEIAEDIRKKIEFSFSEEQDTRRRITVSGGVSENPLDGLDSEELITKARELVSVAKVKGRNRIVVFKEPPVACQ